MTAIDDTASDDTGAVSIPRLLAAYRAETEGTFGALLYAQHITERLIADDVFGRLAKLRDLLDGMYLMTPAQMWVAIGDAVAELDAIAGKE